ncbi:DUF1788 domain-containing protein [Patescibacteria group bacterium]|nr:DUF1788 domain-containing protein [Patescibacteria group bacterium]
MSLTLNQRLEILRTKLSNVNNLNKNNVGGDMKFFIFDFNPKDEMRVRDEVQKAINANAEIVSFDLYQMMLEIIKENGYFETIKNMESEYEKELLLEEVFQPMLALEQTGNEILNRFGQRVADDGKHIVLINGVGKAYPVIRSHTILNNLQSIFKRNPVVMMYPGRFSARKGHLKLFDRLLDDNYYRATPIIERGEDY